MKIRNLVLISIVFSCFQTFAADSAPSTEVSSDAKPVEWLAKQQWSGDLRWRGIQLKEHQDDKRTYQQLRARLQFRADVNENTQAVLRMMTATSAISGNQTLGDPKEPGMTRRNFGLDWGYIDYSFSPTGHIWFGRTANPFWSPNKSQLQFDADLSFEGLAVKWEPKIFTESATLSKSNLFFNVASYMIAENFNDAITPKSDLVDIGLLGANIGLALKAKDWTWTTHVGNYYYLNIQNKPISFSSTATASPKIDPYSNNPNERYLGNTVYTDNPLATTPKYFFQNKYVLMEVGTEWKQQLDPIEYTVFVNYIKNTKVDESNQGYEAGVSVKWKFVTVAYAQIAKGRDAAIGAFTDSDTNGGGTDNRGSRYTLAFQLAKNTNLALIHHVAKRGVDSFQRDFVSTFADLQVSF